MKTTTFIFAIAATVLLSGFTTYYSTNWKIAEGYAIKFTSENPAGIFTSLKGDIQFDESDLATSSCALTIDVASINTGNGMKNKHAKSDKWFDAEKYPTIKFTSTSISKTAPGFETTGTLEMHGVQKQVTLPFTFANNTFTSSFKVNRLDYKIGTVEGMSAKAATDLAIDISIPVTK